MALPMDEQRILEEMERVLAADDPRLAARLAAFGQPGVGPSLRSRHGQATISLMLLAMIAAVAAIIYLFSVLKLGGTPPVPAKQVSSSAQPADRLSASPIVPVAGRAHCVMRVTPRACTAWAASSTTPGKLPARFTLP